MEKDILKAKTLICKDCRRKFTFTIREQMKFGQKDWEDPIRCLYCRRQKKILNLRDEVKMADELKFAYICAKCGREFYSKFRRKSNERVYCDDCWVDIKYESGSRKKDRGVAGSQAEAH